MKVLALILALMTTPVNALTVAIDPGHGGEDPGAIKSGMREADLTLAVAQVIARVMAENGIDAVLTRTSDDTRGLTERLAIVKNAGADVMISIHADSLLIGKAAGLSIYTHADRASTAEIDQLLRQELAAELLFGPLSAQPESDVAGTLMDMAQARTRESSNRLARALAVRFSLDKLPLYQRPIQSGDFVVLRSPAIPAVLIELGFLDSAEDRKRLTDPVWQTTFALSVMRAVSLWAEVNHID